MGGLTTLAKTANSSASAQSTGTLYVVATPIGNLADMVPRAVDVLQSVDLIACEDTRYSARLLEHFSIDTKTTAYHDYSDDRRVERLIERLQAGQNIALISDAGTPLVSDPGYKLVREVRDAGLSMVPIPGACAFVAALSVAGLPSDRFAFEGFLPSKRGARQAVLSALAADTRTLVFYEAPHRILASLQDIVEVMGPAREVVVAREISKTFETLLSGTAAELVAIVAADSNQQRGEIVLLLHGADKKPVSELDAEAERIMALLADELPLKQASTLAAQITGLKKKVLYQWALEQK